MQQVTTRKRRIRLKQLAPFCHYCDLDLTLESRTRDHIVPVAVGGSSSRWNIVSACRRCNLEKSGQWPTCRCFQCQEAVNRYMVDHLVIRDVRARFQIERERLAIALAQLQTTR